MFWGNGNMEIATAPIHQHEPVLWLQDKNLDTNLIGQGLFRENQTDTSIHPLNKKVFGVEPVVYKLWGLLFNCTSVQEGTNFSE